MRPVEVAGGIALTPTLPRPEARGQLATSLPNGSVVISAHREIEEGARGTVLLVDGLFRLDVQPSGDTMRLITRSLSGEALRHDTDGYSGPIVVRGGMAALRALRTCRFDTTLTHRLREQTIVVDVLMVTMRRPDRGAVGCTVHATVRISKDAARDQDGVALTSAS